MEDVAIANCQPEEPSMSDTPFDFSHYKALKIARLKPRLLEVMISQPGKLNAVTEHGHRELANVWRDIDRDPTIDVVLLRGDGGVFSAGGDLDLVKKTAEDWSARMRSWKEASDLVYNVINCSKLTVSAMEGVAVGAGLSAGLLCDITVVGKKTRIIDGHTRLGVAAGDHAAIIWPLLVGMAKSKYYLMLCETLLGEEAEKHGLVSLCVEDDKVVAEAMNICDKLLAGSQVATRFTKYALNNWLRMAGPTFDTALALEMLGFDGPELAEGRAALVEKRKPRFPPQSPF
jgi:enoyl-CoA hydratase